MKALWGGCDGAVKQGIGEFDGIGLGTLIINQVRTDQTVKVGIPSCAVWRRISQRASPWGKVTSVETNPGALYTIVVEPIGHVTNNERGHGRFSTEEQKATAEDIAEADGEISSGRK